MKLAQEQGILELPPDYPPDNLTSALMKELDESGFLDSLYK
mgnify:CR=1 FL=1